MTRDKKGEDGRTTGKRVIVDLSFPLGASVNSGIDRNNFQGEYRSYSLPTPLDLAKLIIEHGPGCFLWKSDLERAYRQLRVPRGGLDYPLLGIQYKGQTYVDICPSFGCRCSGAAQQRVSNALSYIMTSQDSACWLMSTTLREYPKRVNRRLKASPPLKRHVKNSA